jgi:hypothetical protein
MSSSPWPLALSPDARRSGELVPGRAGELLGAAARGRVTGTLLFERGPVKKMVGLRDGQPVLARSNVVAECLGETLVRSGRLSPEARDAALELGRARGLRLGLALLELGRVDAPALAAALGAQMQARLQELVAWKEGDWLFAPRGPAEPDADLPRPLAEVLHRGLAFLEDAELAPLLPPPHRFFRFSSAEASALAATLDAPGARALAAGVHAGELPPSTGRLALAFAWVGDLEEDAPADELIDVERLEVGFGPEEGEGAPADEEASLEPGHAESPSSLAALEDRASAWAQQSPAERLGRREADLLSEAGRARAHAEAVRRAQRELGALRAARGAPRRAFERLLVALDDARAAFEHADVRRRAVAVETPTRLAVLDALDALEAGRRALEMGDAEGFEAARARAEAADPDLTRGAEHDPELRLASAVARAKQRGGEAWADVLALDPDWPEALERAAPSSRRRLGPFSGRGSSGEAGGSSPRR